jgi:hypothetical protein
VSDQSSKLFRNLAQHNSRTVHPLSAEEWSTLSQLANRVSLNEKPVEMGRYMALSTSFWQDVCLVAADNYVALVLSQKRKKCKKKQTHKEKK